MIVACEAAPAKRNRTTLLSIELILESRYVVVRIVSFLCCDRSRSHNGDEGYCPKADGSGAGIGPRLLVPPV